MLWFKRPVFKQPAGIPNYRLGPSYDGTGAERFVFEAEFSLPVLLFRGPGRVAGSLRPLQHPQLYYNYVNLQAGIGGLQAGQLITQPLTDGSVRG